MSVCRQQRSADDNIDALIRDVFGYGERRTAGKLHFDGDRSALTFRQKASLNALEIVADVLGVDIYVYESGTDGSGRRTGANGWYDPKDSSIHLDLYAGANGEGTMLFTAAHELTHFIRQWSPAKFETFADFLFSEYGQKGIAVDALIRAQMEKAKRNGRTIDYDTAYEEVVADSCETMLADGSLVERLAKLKAADRTLWQKIKDFIDQLVSKIRKAYAGLSPDSAEGKYVAQMQDAAERLQALFSDALEDAGAAHAGNRGQKNTAESGDVKNSIRDAFYSEFDSWDGKSQKTFRVGETSDVLKSIGVKDRTVIWHSRKIAQILQKHPAMTRDVIKQVPQILENPVLILESKSSDSRLVMFGTVSDADGNPVTAILELQPTTKGGQLMDMNVIASAYGKDSNPAEFIRSSGLVYLDSNKNRTKNWLQGLGLQLSSDTTAFGSIGSISYQDGIVKIESVPASQYMQEDIKYSAASGDVKYSIRYTTDNRPVAVIDENILEGVPRAEWVKTVKTTISGKFSEGIPISGRLIKVNQKTRNEYTGSKDSQYYKRYDRHTYRDKFQSAGNLDEIVLASTNYVNEDLKHERKDNFKEFARGDVLIRVGEKDYSAQVIIGLTTGNQMVLYDVIDFTPTNIALRTKKEGTHITQLQNAKSDRQSVPSSDTTVSQTDTDVNNQSMQEDTKYSDRDYSYEALTSKPDMTVTTLPAGTLDEQAREVFAANRMRSADDNIDAIIRDVFGYGDAKKEGITEELTEDLLNADASDRIDFYADSRGKLLPAAYKEWLGTSKRDELLGSVNHPKLKKAIDELYRPGSIIGDGGTADIIRFENATGILVSRAGHIRKGIQRIKQMQRIIDGNELSREEKALAQELIRHLQDALEEVQK